MLERCVIRNAAEARWFVLADPIDVLLARQAEQVLDVLREIERRVDRENLLAAGYISYESAAGFDRAYVTSNDSRLPLLCFGLFSQAPNGVVCLDDVSVSPSLWRMTTSRNDYLENLSAIKRQIELGNTYQINYTVRKRAENIARPWELFVATASDAPYAAYIECADHAIVSASPELFFRLNGRHLISKPMKGTAARGLTSAEDRALRQGLYESYKNRAENVMITDMVRNDFGRIAEPGTVSVPSLFDIEKYPTVWQMTSTVSAVTDAPVAEIFRALFPGASVTGAPKASSMEIIAALEDTPREVYTGAIGFIAPKRRAQFNVAIRTSIIDKESNEAVYGVGGGIVWDSDPEEEYRECLTKARILSRPHRDSEFELLETMLWIPEDGFFLLEEHLTRLGASAEYFDFPVDRREIRQALTSLAERLPARRHRVRLLLRRDGQVRLTEAPITTTNVEVPQQISLARQPVDRTDPFIYHKTTRRDVYQLALERAGDVDDVLLWNEDGYITETSIANVVVESGGERYTPPVECGLLAGTYRAILLQKGAIKERKIHVSELSLSSDVTLVNSVRGEYPAKLGGVSIADRYLEKRGLSDQVTLSA